MNLEIENKQVFFTDTGDIFDQKKHSIILLHGSGQSHVVWSLTAQYLSDQNYNVFALDFPGHGNSEGDSLKTIEEMAEWLEKVIVKIGIQNLYNTVENAKNLKIRFLTVFGFSTENWNRSKNEITF